MTASPITFMKPLHVFTNVWTRITFVKELIRPLTDSINHAEDYRRANRIKYPLRFVLQIVKLSVIKPNTGLKIHIADVIAS